MFLNTNKDYYLKNINKVINIERLRNYITLIFKIKDYNNITVDECCHNFLNKFLNN